MTTPGECARLLPPTKKKKLFVFLSPPADRSAELMPLVFRQKRNVCAYSIYDYLFEGERIDGPPVAAAVIPERLSVDLIRSALGDGVYHAAGGAAIFRGVVRTVDLEFLNG